MQLTVNQKLALQVAKERNVYIPIVMATIEAETNFRNVLGTYKAASAKWGGGFGQVHPAWHATLVRRIAQELNIELPPAFAQIPWRRGAQPWNLILRSDPRAIATRYVLDEIIVKNDLFSMHLSVEMIGQVWKQSDEIWEIFTRAYVGRGITARDLARRRAIWNKWQTILKEDN